MYFRSRICMAQNLCREQVVKRDVINAESCYQENGEEVRRQEAREEECQEGRQAQRQAEREEVGKEAPPALIRPRYSFDCVRASAAAQLIRAMWVKA